MKMQYCTIGPIPVPSIVPVMSQTEEHGWESRFLTFAGLIQVPSKVNIMKPEVIPSFLLVVCKETIEGVEASVPTIKL